MEYIFTAKNVQNGVLKGNTRGLPSLLTQGLNLVVFEENIANAPEMCLEG